MGFDSSGNDYRTALGNNTSEPLKISDAEPTLECWMLLSTFFLFLHCGLVTPPLSAYKRIHSPIYGVALCHVRNATKRHYHILAFM